MVRVACIGVRCDHCGSEQGVELEPSRTAYPHKVGEPDPNAPIPLCRQCAQGHHDYWDEMWEHARPEL